MGNRECLRASGVPLSDKKVKHRALQHMKKIIQLTIIAFFLTLGISVANSQETSPTVDPSSTVLVVSSYSSRSDLDFLFTNSTVALKYLEGTEIDHSVYLGLTTLVQKLLIEKRGLPVTILDENPDISHYKLYFTYESDQSELLKPYGDVFPLTPHHILVRYAQDVSNKDPLHQANAQFPIEFFETPLSGQIPTPKYQTATITLAPTIIASQQTIQTSPNPLSASSLSVVIVVVLGSVVIIGIIAVFIFKRLRSQGVS